MVWPPPSGPRTRRRTCTRPQRGRLLRARGPVRRFDESHRPGALHHELSDELRQLPRSETARNHPCRDPTPPTVLLFRHAQGNPTLCNSPHSPYPPLAASCSRSFAPVWVDRIYNLAVNGYYDQVHTIQLAHARASVPTRPDSPRLPPSPSLSEIDSQPSTAPTRSQNYFFRVIEGFVVQFGTNGNPAVSNVYNYSFDHPCAILHPQPPLMPVNVGGESRAQLTSCVRMVRHFFTCQQPAVAHRDPRPSPPGESLSNTYGTLSMSTSYSEITNTTWNATAELFINIGDNAAKLGELLS